MAKKEWGLRLYETVAGMDRLNEQGKLVRRLVKKHQDGTLGTPTADDETGDDMGSVNIGDQSNIHYHLGTDQGQAPKSNSGLLTGLALGLGGPLLAGALFFGSKLLPSQKDQPTKPATYKDTWRNLDFKE